MTRLQRNINLLFIFLFTAYTAYTIFFQQAGVFFLVYLFLLDEVIRNISLIIQNKWKRKNKTEEEQIVNKVNLQTIKARFFFMFIYSVFIVIAFGIFFHLGKDSSDKLFENLQIIFFQHTVFNLCLCIAIVREIMIIRTQSLLKAPMEVLSPMDNHLITLHLSIILGAFLWMLTNKGQSIQISLGPLNPYAMVLPFLIIKFIVDLYATKKAFNNAAIYVGNI